MAGAEMKEETSQELAEIPSALLLRANEITHLDLSHNPGLQLSATIAMFINLKVLNLRDTRLVSIPIELEQLTQLTALDLAWNQLTTLPDCLGKLSSLTTLDLEGNQLTSLPDCLGMLSSMGYPNRNAIRHLPLELSCNTSLRTLDMSGNPMVRPPLPICDQGIDGVRMYLKDLRFGTVCRQTLSMLGETGAGKTSIVMPLHGGKRHRASPDERTSVMSQTQMYHPDGRVLVINDFGGHSIYQTVLPVFLPPSGIGIIVYDMSKSLETQTESVDRWMTTAFAKSPALKLIIVGSHLDCPHGNEEDHKILMQRFVRTKVESTLEELTTHVSTVESVMEESESKMPWAAIKSKWKGAYCRGYFPCPGCRLIGKDNFNSFPFDVKLIGMDISPGVHSFKCRTCGLSIPRALVAVFSPEMITEQDCTDVSDFFATHGGSTGPPCRSMAIEPQELQKNIPKLVENMSDVNIIIDILYSKKVLSLYQKEELQACRVRHRQVGFLLSMLERKSSVCIGAFVQALRDTNQHNLVALFGGSTGRSMAVEVQELRRNTFKLIDRMSDVSVIIAILYSKKVLSVYEKEELEACQVRHKRVRLLLNMLEGKSSVCIDTFVQALEETNQHALAALFDVSSMFETPTAESAAKHSYLEQKLKEFNPLEGEPVDVDIVIDMLIEREVLTASEKMVLQAAADKYQRVVDLLSNLTTKDVADVDKFVDVLIKVKKLSLVPIEQDTSPSKAPGSTSAEEGKISEHVTCEEDTYVVGCTDEEIGRLVHTFTELRDSGQVSVGSTYGTDFFVIGDFDERGGFLILRKMSAYMEIPRGALKHKKTVYFSILADSNREGACACFSLCYDCGPNGTTFDLPVILHIPHSLRDSETGLVTAFTRRKESREWIISTDAKVSFQNGRATIGIQHFCPFWLGILRSICWFFRLPIWKQLCISFIVDCENVRFYIMEPSAFQTFMIRNGPGVKETPYTFYATHGSLIIESTVNSKNSSTFHPISIMTAQCHTILELAAEQKVVFEVRQDSVDASRIRIPVSKAMTVAAQTPTEQRADPYFLRLIDQHAVLAQQLACASKGAFKTIHLMLTKEDTIFQLVLRTSFFSICCDTQADADESTLLRWEFKTSFELPVARALIEAAKSVCFIRSLNRHTMGTGFRIGPQHILTAWHVVEKIEARAEIEVIFDYNTDQQTTFGMKFNLTQTYKQVGNLDAVILELNSTSVDGKILPPCLQTANVSQNVCEVHVIGHHEGKHKQLDKPCKVHYLNRREEERLRNNDSYLGMLLDPPVHLLYTCGLGEGASGGPVLSFENGTLTVIAMHLRRFPKERHALPLTERFPWYEAGLTMSAIHGELQNSQEYMNILGL